MSADIKTTANGNFVKISTRQSTPTQNPEAKSVAVEHYYGDNTDGKSRRLKLAKLLSTKRLR
jgi:hypothetical protein